MDLAKVLNLKYVSLGAPALHTPYVDLLHIGSTEMIPAPNSPLLLRRLPELYLTIGKSVIYVHTCRYRRIDILRHKPL